jgi:hypothetical protein
MKLFVPTVLHDVALSMVGSVYRDVWCTCYQNGLVLSL